MSYEQAREFLARVVPWPEADEPGYVNIHWAKQSVGFDKPLFDGRACRTLDAAISTIGWASSLPDVKDIYVCMSSQAQAEERTAKVSGKKYLKAHRNQNTALALKSLFLDIDAKGKDSYADVGEAVDALNKFLGDSGLPKPSMLVRSGGGLHVYWTMERALSPDEWRPLAHALVEATKRHGLRCDTGVTTDAARVLRVPETFNRKTEPPRPVILTSVKTEQNYAVDYLKGKLASYEVHTSKAEGNIFFLNPELFPPRPPLSSPSPLSAGVDTTMDIAELQACLDAIPNTKADWNYWNTTGMRVYAATDGEDYGLVAWQAWSDKNPAAGTADNCQSRWETYHTSPPSRTGPGALVNEARKATGNPSWSPRPAASLPPQVTPAPPTDLPDGYIRRSNGKVYELLVDDKGGTHEILVVDYELTKPWFQKDPNTLHFSSVIHRGTRSSISIGTGAVATQEMRRVLQDQGLMVGDEKRVKALGKFLSMWIKKLQETRDSVQSCPFGWQVNPLTGMLDGFVYGGRLWTPTGDSTAALPDPVLAQQYRPSGTKVPWLTASKMVTDQKRQDLAAVVASAFAAPLVRFTGHPGVLMSVRGAGGIGKSTAMKVAQAVWGDPVKAMQSLSDTQNSVMNKLGEIRNLPLYWDELKTEEDTKKFVLVTFQVTQGKEKSRMTSKVTQRELGKWQTLLISASNDSLLDYVVSRTSTNTAGLHRIFEYVVQPGTIGQIALSTAGKTIGALDDNYGQIGYEYAKWLGENHAQIDQEVSDFMVDLGTEIGVTQEERFWQVLIATICMGARYANQLGYTDFDLDALKAFMFKSLDGMRKQRAAETVDLSDKLNVAAIVSQFLTAHRGRHTLITNRLFSQKGKPTPGSIKIIGDTSKLEGVYVHIGLENKLMRVNSLRFSNWCKDTGRNRRTVLEALEKELTMKRVMGRLGAGTSYSHATGTDNLLEFDLNGTPYLDMIDEA